MTTFDDVLHQLVQRLRRTPAGAFVPHAVPGRRGAPITSYRELYRCPASTWGNETDSA